MTIRLPAAISLCAVALLAACHPAATNETASKAGTGLGIQTAWMDTNAKPGDDWYEYANGTWMKTTQIPADRSNVGGFYIADEKTRTQLGALIAHLHKSTPTAGSDEAKVKDFYDAYLDTKAIDAAGMAPVQPALAKFAAITDKQQLASVLGSQIRADVDPLNNTNFATENLFGVFVTQAL